MKTLKIIAISTTTLMMLTASKVGVAQLGNLKNALGATKGKLYAKDLTEEKTIELLGGLKTDDGVNGEFHQSHLNQIVFTAGDMKPEDINAGTIKSKYGINETIYFTVYLPKSVRNYVVYPIDENGEFMMDYYYDKSFKKWKSESGAYNTRQGLPAFNDYGSNKLEFYVDGKLVDAGVFLQESGYNSTKTILQGYIYRDPSVKQPSNEWKKFAQELAEGEHEIKMVLYGYKTGSSSDKKITKEAIATGSFTLVKNPGETFSPTYGKKWDDYADSKNDPALAKDILAAIQIHAKNNNYKESFSDVKISERDWSITRHQVTGVVLYRDIMALCYSTWPDGSCKVQHFMFRQDHDGTGYQNTIYCTGAAQGSYQTSVDCE